MDEVIRQTVALGEAVGGGAARRAVGGGEEVEALTSKVEEKGQDASSERGSEKVEAASRRTRRPSNTVKQSRAVN